MIVVTAPETIPINKSCVSIFLAGSIEQGLAEEWQSKVIEYLKDSNVVVLNPRRTSWDSSWNIDPHDKRLQGQINWEQEGLVYSDIVFFYFAPNTMSPVTLLELGEVLGWNFASDQKIVVCCPEKYWRYSNVLHTCKRFGVDVHININDALQELTKLTKLE